tara:strand:+ start:490 stop:1743 length:1254 start_codon:yes stop_codon:yes gene_type:complete
MTSKLNQFLSKNFKLIIFISFYSTILIGFYLGENSTVGPKIDFLYHLKTLYSFDVDLTNALVNFNTIDFPTRISPIFLLYLFYLKNIFTNIDLMRFISINIFLISPFVFYNCLKIKFNHIDRNFLFFFSSFLYLSPSFRGNTIWPESSMLGLLFFLFAVYCFLKFEKDKKFLYSILNVIFLSIAAYIRPSYSLFAIFFFIAFYREYLTGYKIFLLFLINILLSFPAFYYIFILEVSFINSHGLSFNISNKILIISSIIFFYLFPFLITIYRFNKKEISFKKFIYFFIASLVVFFCLVPYFNYDLSIAGGGIFLHLSHYLLSSNNIFFIVSFISILSISYILMIDTKKNFLLILIFFLIVPQTHIFHKYFDPILLICLPLLFQLPIEKIFKKKSLFILFLFFLCFYLINLSNSLFIKF